MLRLADRTASSVRWAAWRLPAEPQLCAAPAEGHTLPHGPLMVHHGALVVQRGERYGLLEHGEVKDLFPVDSLQPAAFNASGLVAATQHEQRLYLGALSAQ